MSSTKELIIGDRCGHIVKQVRLEMNCTQSELSRKIGISPSVLCKIERRDILPKESVVEKLARLAGVSPYQLTGQEPICYAAIR